MRSVLVCGIVIHEKHEATQTKNKLTKIMSQLELNETNFGDNEPEAQEFLHGVKNEHPEAGIDLEPAESFEW